jgi:hypothetical protein
MTNKQSIWSQNLKGGGSAAARTKMDLTEIGRERMSWDRPSSDSAAAGFIISGSFPVQVSDN